MNYSNNHIKNIVPKLHILLLCFFFSIESHAQYTDGTTGLLHLPNAEVQNDGTFMLGGNFLNKHNLPNDNWWGYNTFNYYLNVTLFDRIEISYICTLVQGKPNNGYHWPESTWGRFANQDRHFASKIQLVKEGEWWKHMPAIAIGFSDPTTGGGPDYLSPVTSSNTNCFFYKKYIAITKHFKFNNIGDLGLHATYLKNNRTDYQLNGIGWGINLCPDFHRNLNLIVEHDTKTLNVGALYSLWADHFNFLFELQDGKYISAGFAYKVKLKGGNRWKSKLFDY